MPWRLIRSGGIAPPIFTSALDEGQRPASSPDLFTPEERAPGTHWIGGCVGLRADLGPTKKRKISYFCRESNPGRPARSASLYRLSCLDAKLSKQAYTLHFVIYAINIYPCIYDVHSFLVKCIESKECAGFEVLTAVVMKGTIFWDITTCKGKKR
jgi:hypothetical protein